MAVGLAALVLGACGRSGSGRQSCGTCHVLARAVTADPATDSGLPVPLGGRNMDHNGSMPTLHKPAQFYVTRDINALTDGFDPKNPVAYNLPAQCAPGAE